MKNFVGNEIMYLHSPDINVCFKVRIDINLPADVFQNAVKMVEHKHPMLKYVIKTNDDGQKYYEASGGVSIQFYMADKMDWQKWRDETDNIPFKFENESLVKIAVIQGNGYSDIVFLGHHILAGNYTTVIITAAIASVVVIFVLLFRKKIIAKIIDDSQ